MKKLMHYFFVLTILLPVVTISVFADTGPKPTVTLKFRGFENPEFYVTLLAEVESTGPYSWAGFRGTDSQPPSEDPEIWQAFVDYEDEDGFYFLQYYQKPELREDADGQYRLFVWDYYPPERFKVLIYYPETEGFFICDEIMDTYAFHSQYEVTSLYQGELHLGVDRTYGYGWEAFAFLVRLLMTIGFEIMIALGFGYKSKEQLLIIIGTNVVTQLALNIRLLFGAYETWFIVYILTYGLWEIIIFVVEALIYKFSLEKVDEPYAPKKMPVLYALCANVTSFVMGYIISQWFPYVF